MNHSKRATLRQIAASAAALLTGSTLTAQAFAQTFPAKPVILMIPYPAGGLSDNVTRRVNVPLGAALGQPAIVENLGGASGSIAAQKVLNSPSDGYLVFQGSPNELILAPLAISAVKYKAEDFRQIHRVALAPMAIFARAGLPAKNADELVAYATKAAKEGKPLPYASVGPGSFYHLLGAKMSNELHIEMTHVPYRGAAPAHIDLAGGRVHMIFDNIPGSLAQMAAGKANGLGVTSLKRSPSAPDVPAMAEFLPGFDVNSWGGICGPAGLPPTMVEKLSALTKKALESDDLKATYLKQGATPLWTNPSDTAAYRRADEQRLAPVIKASGAKVD